MKGPARRAGAGWAARAGAAAAGAAMIVVPAVTGRAGGPAAFGLALAAAGLLLVAASTALAGFWLVPLAAVLPVALAIVNRPGWPALAADGLLILAYLILSDAPRGAPSAGARRWLRRQMPAAGAGAAATVITATALAVSPPVSVWLLVIGIAAVAAAVLIAVPQAARDRDDGSTPS